MRILHENPETACAKMSSLAQFMTIEFCTWILWYVYIMLQFMAKP